MAETEQTTTTKKKEAEAFSNLRKANNGVEQTTQAAIAGC